MAKFKYVGEEMLVGRFGRLKKGDVRELWQSEVDFLTERGSTEWKDVSKDDNEGVGTIVPVHTVGFDLTRVDWLRETRSSLVRMSRSELLEVTRSMRLIHCRVPSEDEARQMTKENLFETLYGEVKRLRWDVPRHAKVDRGPKKSETPVIHKEDAPKRAHHKDGKFKEDDEDTAEVNEAYDPPKQAKKAVNKIKRKR